jgi:hypothetical protein
MGKVIFDQDKNPVTIDTNYLYVSPESDKFLLQPPKIYNGTEKHRVNNRLPQYVPFICETPVKTDGWYARLKRLLADCPKCTPTARSSTGWVQFFEEFNAQSTSKGAVLQNINRSTDKLFVIVLSNPTHKRPCGQLGTVLLWNRTDENIKARCEMRIRRLKTAATYLSVFISQLLKSQYSVQNDIYPYQSETDHNIRPRLSEIKCEPDPNFAENKPELSVTG